MWSDLIVYITIRILSVLITFSVQSAIVLIGMSGVAYLLRHQSASIRHRLWSLTLGGIFILPILPLWLPAWNVTSPKVVIWTPPLDFFSDGQPLEYPSEKHNSVLFPQAQTSPEIPEATRKTNPEVLSVSAKMVTTILGLIIFTWVAGVLVMTTRIVIGIFRVRRLARHAVPLTENEWVRLIRLCTNRMEIRRPVTVLLSARQSIPVTWGLVRPTILLPIAALEWSDSQRTAVVMHELAHIRRFDALVQIVIQLTTTVFWFNPWIWNAVRHIRLDAEHACDDLVLLAGVSPISYANHLVRVARMSQVGYGASRMAWGALAMAQSVGLETRVLAILNPATDRRLLRHRDFAGMTVIVVLITLLTGGFQPIAAAVMPVESKKIEPSESSGIRQSEKAWHESEKN